MAVALHSLKDSFAIMHVAREHYTDPQNHGAITELFEFDKQHKKLHAESDYSSVKLYDKDIPQKAVPAHAAIYACAQLMLLAIKSLEKKSQKLVGWEAYRSKWLKPGFEKARSANAA